MAWIGLVAVIGLVICAVDAVVSAVRARRPPRERRTERGPQQRRRSLLILVGALASVLILVVVLSRMLSGGGSGGGAGAGSAFPHTRTSRSGPPRRVHVEVVNASGVPKAAASTAQALSTLGYLIAGTGNAARTAGTTVACRTGFAKEANALAHDVGPSATIHSFPTPAPSGSESADCIVVLGR